MNAQAARAESAQTVLIKAAQAAAETDGEPAQFYELRSSDVLLSPTFKK